MRKAYMIPFSPRSAATRHRDLGIVLCIVTLLATAASCPAGSIEGVEPPIAGPRDLLRLHGVEDGLLDSLQDGIPLNEEETETLLTVLYWIRGFRTLDLQQWSQGQADPARIVADPNAARGQVFLLSGHVARVELFHPSPDATQRYELPHYYRCELILDQSSQPVVIFVEDVPRQWQDGGAAGQRAAALGLLMKLTSDDPDRPEPLFVARHIAWYPSTLLGELGMDVGLLDDVVDFSGLGRSRRADAPEEVARAAGEREAFYAMLDAVARAKPQQLRSHATELLQHADDDAKRTDLEGDDQFSVVPMLVDPRQHRGQLLMFTGRARRVVRVQVEDPDIVARFNIDHYYEVSLFTDEVPNKKIILQGDPIVLHQHPIIFCVPELPEGMPTGDGLEYDERLTVAGFFFKLWSYHGSSSHTDTQSSSGPEVPQQWAFLLIGSRPVWHAYRPPEHDYTAEAIAGGIFVLVVLCIWLALWRSSRADKRFHERTIASRHALATDVSLDKNGLDAHGSPSPDEPDKTDSPR